jgi:hypothetical protein
MTYRFDELSIILSDDKESFEKINDIYNDIFNGKIPLIHDSKRKLDENLIVLAQYKDYKEDAYTFSVFADDCDTLLQIHKWINYGDITLFEGEGSTINEARINAREKLIEDTKIKRTFRNDFECIVPKNDSKDGKVHCSLYVGIENKYNV